MKNNTEYVGYEQALTDSEILLYAQMINQFKNGEIDYLSLKEMFLSYGVNIEPVVNDISVKKATVSETDVVKKRLLEQQYLYSDINHFILNSSEFKNVVFKMDYKAIEMLADYGIPEYQETMISILREQLRITMPTNEKIAIERSKWKRRIAELESQLSKNNNVNKSK